jgi:hypothetical protein
MKCDAYRPNIVIPATTDSKVSRLRILCYPVLTKRISTLSRWERDAELSRCPPDGSQIGNELVSLKFPYESCALPTNR